MTKYAVVNVKFGADIKSFNTAIQNATKQMRAAGREMQKIGRDMTIGITLPIVGLGVAALKAYANIDKLKRGLATFAGSAEDAEREFKKLRAVAKLPGIGLEEAVRGSNNLQAIGLSAERAREVMTALGNAIATVGGGREQFDLAIYGFSQLTNTAKPFQQDLNQIANNIPQINKILKDTFGSQRADDIAKLGKTGKEVADLLILELSKLPPVTGGIYNAFENLSDTIKIALGGVGEEIDKSFGVTEKLTAFGDWLMTIVEGFKKLRPEIKTTILVIAGLVAATGPLLIALGLISKILPILQLGLLNLKKVVTQLVGLFSIATLEVLATIAVIVAMGTIGIWLYDNWVPIKTKMINLFKEMSRGIIDGLTQAGLAIKEFYDFFGIKTPVLDGILLLGKSLGDMIPENEVVGDLGTIEQAFKNTWEKIKKIVKDPSLKEEIKEQTKDIKTIDNVVSEGVGVGDKLPEFKLKSKQPDWGVVKKELAKIELPEVEFKTNNFERGWETLKEKMIRMAKELTDSIKSILVNGITDAINETFALIGENIAEKEDPFKNLGKTLLNSLGKLMTIVGSAMVAWGISLLEFEESLMTLNAPKAIAAGVAMIAAGQIISATAKKGLKGQGTASEGTTMSGSSYGGKLVLETKLDGRDLQLSGERTERVMRR